MKTKLALIAILALSMFAGCKDDETPYSCSSCANEPEANAIYDNTGQGVYKGVIVGSSGTLVFYIANDGSTMHAVLEIDNKRVELTATGAYNSETGYTGNFTGELNGEDVSITFAVNSSGGFEVYNIEIPDHPYIDLRMFKEYSDELVMGFEGTHTGDPSGHLNIAVRLNESGSGVWYAVSRAGEYPNLETRFYQGEVSEDGTLTGGGGEVTVEGAIDGDAIKGTWETTESSGTWKGRRTL